MFRNFQDEISICHDHLSHKAGEAAVRKFAGRGLSVSPNDEWKGKSDHIFNHVLMAFPSRIFALTDNKP